MVTQMECLEASDNDKCKAIQYAKFSADRGNPNGMCQYGRFLVDGELKNETEAAHFLKEAADRGIAEAMFAYVNMIQNGDISSYIKDDYDRYCMRNF